MKSKTSDAAGGHNPVPGDDSAGSGPWVSKGLVALLTTQGLGAYNDNLLKTVVSLMLVGRAVESTDGSAYLSLTGVAFVLPYLIFSGYAGHLADCHRKRSVIVLAKCAEVFVILASIAALLLDRTNLMIAALFLMATQSAFISPAKYGLLPEMLPASRLSQANGLIESTRYLAVILGTVTGGLLLAVPGSSLSLISAVLMGTAMIGVASSLWISRTPISGKTLPVRGGLWHGMSVGFRHLQKARALKFSIFGITCLEFLGCLVLLDLILAAKTTMRLGDVEVGILGGCVGLGAACGSYISGRVSGAHVRPTFSFVGVTGVATVLVALSAVVDFHLAAVLIFVLGMFGGGAVVPLYALLQREAESGERGQIIATNNFLNMTGVLLASGALWLLNGLLGFSPEQILFWSGVALLLLTGIALHSWPEYGFYPIARVRWLTNPTKSALAARLKSAPNDVCFQVKRTLLTLVNLDCN